ncbi:hypothetical protein LCGC14_1277680 [marine sediment metagenome]|uniref:GMP reductase n=1 Tax=marine sediment metagenome TaxID=412755 RepID=A0A0F9LHD7_9ZZZZ
MRIENDVKLDYNNVLLRPKRSRLLSRSEVTLTRKFKFPHSPEEWEGVPIVVSNMHSIGTFPVARLLGVEYQMLTCIHKHYTLEQWIQACEGGLDWNHAIPSMGIGKPDWKKIESIYSDGFAPIIRNEIRTFFKWLCLDVANGYSQPFAENVERARNEYPESIIIAGNVATAEMTEALILHGADIVKVGIGPGSACTTRKVTGVGYPQLSAVIECADAAHGLDGHIMADGGCNDPGDVAKAFCAGADFVMLGGMLAGHDETGSEFYGMSSNKAQEKYGGELKDYRASEGREVTVERKGPLKDTIREILGGLRSACTYIGATELKHAPKCATFVRTEQQYNTVYGT